MASPNYTGPLFSFASATIDFGGKKFYGISAINISQENTPEDVYGNDLLPIGRTAGQFKASGDFEQVIGEYALLLDQLGDNYMLKTFNIGVQLRENDGERMLKMEILSVRLTKEDFAFASGAGATKVKVPISIIRPIRINGRQCVVRSFNNGLRVSPALLAA